MGGCCTTNSARSSDEPFNTVLQHTTLDLCTTLVRPENTSSFVHPLIPPRVQEMLLSMCSPSPSRRNTSFVLALAEVLSPQEFVVEDCAAHAEWLRCNRETT